MAMVKRPHNFPIVTFATVHTDLGECFRAGTSSDIPDVRWSEDSACPEK